MPPAEEEARAALLSAARQLLELAEGPADGALTVVVAPGRALVVADGGPAPAAPPRRLPPLQRAILAVLAPEPQPAGRLAALAHRTLNSRFYEALAALVEARLARHTRRGYARA